MTDLQRIQELMQEDHRTGTSMLTTTTTTTTTSSATGSTESSASTGSTLCYSWYQIDIPDIQYPEEKPWKKRFSCFIYKLLRNLHFRK